MKVQRPRIEDNWLYKDQMEERLFRKIVYLPDNAEPWAECTNLEREEFERTHPTPEPEPEPKQEQPHE